jgi:hypothetical protein
MIIGVASADWVGPNKSSDGNAYWGGSGWARVGQFLEHLPYKVAVGYLAWKHDHLIITDVYGTEHHPDVLILQRLMHTGLANHIALSQAYGQIIINDVDDWYWGLDPRNNAWHHSHPKTNSKENVNHYRSIISRSAYVTVSTPYLLGRLSPVIKGESLLFRNTIDISKFSVKEHTEEDCPVVGWAGSTAHRSGDLETVSGILKPLHSNGDIRLMHVGHHEGAPTFASRVGVPEEAVSVKPLVTSDLYPQSLTMDIGIVPLRVAPFNQSKSYIKGLEYSAAGLPFIAQSIDSYDELYKEGIGRIAKRPHHWISHLKKLKDPLLRKEEGLNNRELVTAHDLRYGIKRWLDLLQSLPL